ncbi:MAG: MBL fold metallo-hydrolase [Desulfuromonadales bacterium]|nr:MBL fold metallo-hydrolase [Desulfuromonadales bacterium]
MQVTILGSGTSTGVPQAGCRCPVCTSDLPRNARTRCSILVSFAGRNLLIDTATDLRQQVLREKISRIDAVLYTHTHADHLHGIDDLRPFNLVARGAIPVFGSRESIQVIRRVFAYIFDEAPDPGYRPNLTTFPVVGPFSLFGLPVLPIPLRHGRGHSLGYRLGPLAYLTDCSAIPPESEPLLQGLELLIIDGLRFTPHATHFNIPQALAAAARLAPRRTLLTHLSHEVDHDRHSADLPPGIEFAYDGQQLSLSAEKLLES